MAYFQGGIHYVKLDRLETLFGLGQIYHDTDRAPFMVDVGGGGLHHIAKPADSNLQPRKRTNADSESAIPDTDISVSPARDDWCLCGTQFPGWGT